MIYGSLAAIQLEKEIRKAVQGVQLSTWGIAMVYRNNSYMIELTFPKTELSKIHSVQHRWSTHNVILKECENDELE